MVHTSMHELMLGMFLGGVVLAAPPVLIGLVVVGWLLKQRRREEDRSDLRDNTGE